MAALEVRSRIKNDKKKYNSSNCEHSTVYTILCYIVTALVSNLNRPEAALKHNQLTLQ